MGAGQPAVVILFGKMAIDTFLPRMPLEQAVGQTFDLDGVTYVPLPHSSGRQHLAQRRRPPRCCWPKRSNACGSSGRLLVPRAMNAGRPGLSCNLFAPACSQKEKAMIYSIYTMLLLIGVLGLLAQTLLDGGRTADTRSCPRRTCHTPGITARTRTARRRTGQRRSGAAVLLDAAVAADVFQPVPRRGRDGPAV